MLAEKEQNLAANIDEYRLRRYDRKSFDARRLSVGEKCKAKIKLDPKFNIDNEVLQNLIIGVLIRHIW